MAYSWGAPTSAMTAAKHPSVTVPRHTATVCPSFICKDSCGVYHLKQEVYIRIEICKSFLAYLNRHIWAAALVSSLTTQYLDLWEVLCFRSSASRSGFGLRGARLLSMPTLCLSCSVTCWIMQALCHCAVAVLAICAPLLLCSKNNEADTAWLCSDSSAS